MCLFLKFAPIFVRSGDLSTIWKCFKNQKYLNVRNSLALFRFSSKCHCNVNYIRLVGKNETVKFSKNFLKNIAMIRLKIWVISLAQGFRHKDRWYWRHHNRAVWKKKKHFFCFLCLGIDVCMVWPCGSSSI